MQITQLGDAKAIHRWRQPGNLNFNTLDNQLLLPLTRERGRCRTDCGQNRELAQDATAGVRCGHDGSAGWRDESVDAYLMIRRGMEERRAESHVFFKHSCWGKAVH